LISTRSNSFSSRFPAPRFAAGERVGECQVERLVPVGAGLQSRRLRRHLHFGREIPGFDDLAGAITVSQ
jgi:hypothetical protein